MPLALAKPKIPAAIGAISFSAEAVFPPKLGDGTFTNPATGKEVQKVSFGTAVRRYKIIDADGAQIEWLGADHADLHPFTVYLLGQALGFQAKLDAAAIGLPVDLTPRAPVVAPVEPVVEPVADPEPEPVEPG